MKDSQPTHNLALAKEDLNFGWSQEESLLINSTIIFPSLISYNTKSRKGVYKRPAPIKRAQP
jgi:hypothetical protein